MKKILFVFGTRPEVIKLAPLIHECRRSCYNFDIKICSSSQHREMLTGLLQLFNLELDYDLDIMQNDQNLFDITANLMYRLEPVLRKEQPDLMLVQGDTSSAFAAALAAFYSQIKLGHVEAGLRTGDKSQPFPEEMNRRLIDCLADYYFCPTKTERDNLKKEGFPENRLFITGNTVIDALLQISEKQKSENIQNSLEDLFRCRYGISFQNHKTILVTAHRRESFGEALKNICLALRELALRNLGIQIVYPVHLNPNVQCPVREILRKLPRIHLIEPLDYNEFVFLMNRSFLILTDSGGIQEEAPSLGKPVLVLRKKTDRPEGIKAGTARIVGTNPEKIVSETVALLNNKKIYRDMEQAANPYGDGRASAKIAVVLERELMTEKSDKKWG